MNPKEIVRSIVGLLTTTPQSRSLKIIQNIIFYYIVFVHLAKFKKSVAFHGLAGTFKAMIWAVGKVFLSTIRTLPTPASSAIQSEIAKTLKELEKSIIPPRSPSDPEPYTALPSSGLDNKKLKSELVRYKKMAAVDYLTGKVSGAVYHGGEELNSVVTEAYGMFCSSNPLHPDLFPGIRKMEAEIVAMTLKLFNADVAKAGGNLTSGGTESILMACKAYREKGRIDKGIEQPEIIAAVTVHAAFDKAAHYFNIKLVHIPLDKDGRIDIALVKKAINKNTIMLVGSAPNFPHGIIDDIETLAALGVKHNIPVHVDCCLGSFLMPFMDKAGFPVPKFDFRVKGVTSMSVDTHKYGFAPKGSSVVMYSSKDLRKHQYFVAPDWTGGIYASPTIAGSRPGALIAGCWTAMMKMGEAGYLEATKKIISTARKIEEGIRKIPSLEVLYQPRVSVIAFTASSPLNIYTINDYMSTKGWNLNALQYPSAIHIAVTMLTTNVADQFLIDLNDAVEECKARVAKGEKLSGSAAIYGMAASIPDRSVVEDIVTGYLDIMLKT
ncbi:pyridoxal phosphate-dependent transferase [Paraphysoderma sedebokerense]|nr:pyridoxal phosphate-dependent transferase [Paraphysoderma sedebokerense]